MHPKIGGITSKLIARSIKTVELAEVLRGQETDGRGRDVMAWHAEVKVCAVFAYECPADNAIAGHFSRSIDGLDLTHGALEVLDEVVPIGCDRECTPGIEDDVDDRRVASGAREESSDEVRVKVGSGELSIESVRDGRREEMERWNR